MLAHFKRPNFVLLACQPKSASTFIANTLSTLPKSRNVRLVPGYDRREQEICEQRLRRYRFRKPRHLIAQAHVRHSAPTQVLIEKYRINVVVITRNPLDTIVSMRDHMRQESVKFPFAFLTEAHRDLPDDDLDMVIARFVLPWIINFHQSWKDHPTAYIIDYSEFVQDQAKAISRIAKRVNIPASQSDIDQALTQAAGLHSRQNIGKSGRGQHLSPSVISAVTQMVEDYAAGQPELSVQDILTP